jgi:TldD protein
MLDKLKSILAGVDADYADIRYEVKQETKISFSGKELTGMSSSATDGHVVRVLKGGGFSSVAFTRLEDAQQALATATENASLVAKRTRKPVKLAPVEAVRAEVLPTLDEDPVAVTAGEKLALLKEYNDIPLGNEKVATTQMSYIDIIREKCFVSTEGAEIKEKLVTVRMGGAIITKEGDLTQTVRVGFGGSDGLGTLRSRHDLVEDRTRIAVDLLKAEPVKAGTYRVILDQHLAGVFTHEAFGHFSEADLIEDSPTMREKMQIGAKLGTDVVNILDDPTIPHQLGHYKYDDEGVLAEPTQLMKDGVLVGRLHSRRTAAAFDEPVNGHCVAEDYRYAPIIRMGTIFIESDSKSFDELMAELGDGLYLINPMGGQTTGENFTFGAQYGFEVKDGRKQQMLRDINITGNLYHTLESIVDVGNDLKLGEVGGCGKGQLNLRSCYGAPHILVEDLVIGGK